MVSVQDWKAAQYVSPDDTAHVAAIEALASLLEGNMTPADAAQSITTTYAASVKAMQRQISWHTNDVADFWKVFMTNASRCFGGAEEHERFYELLIEISRQPDLEDDDSFVVTSNSKTYWVDLPFFDGCFAHAGLEYKFAQDFSLADRGLFLSQRQRFLNGTKFAAVLLRQNKFASGLPLYTSYLLKIGLEHSFDGNSEDVARVDCEEWETLVPAATTGLSIAGKAIYEHCQKNDLYDRWEKGTRNLQRWNLWKQQLERFVEREDFSDECRSLASQTTKRMAEVEAENQAEPLSSEMWWPVNDMDHELRSSNFPVD